MTDSKYEKIASNILAEVGGPDNISKATHCATRLRLFLKEDVPLSQLDDIDGVVSAVKNAGQYQVVIGQDVRNVYEAFMAQAGLTSKEESDEVEEKDDTSILNRIIGTMSAVFAPFVYILAAAGILQAVLIVLTTFWPSLAETGTYQIFNLISWAPFVFLPIFIAVTASRHFNSNPYIAMTAAMALVSPTLTEIISQVAAGQSFTLFGFQLSPTAYTSSVLPPLFMVWGISYLEKWLNRSLPETLRPIFTPLLSIVIAVPATLLIVGPITAGAASMVASGYNWLYESVPVVAGGLLGGLWQLLVLFGIHWGIMPIMLQNFNQFGYDSLQAFTSIAVTAQAGAALGVALKSKDEKTKRAGLSGFLPGLFGITEPAIYGVNLRYKKPFVIACISGAVGALVAAMFKARYFAYAGLPGPLTVVNAINADFPTAFWGELIGVVIALILPIILLMILGYGDDAVADVSTDDKSSKSRGQDKVAENTASSSQVYPVMSGQRIELADVPDPVFSAGIMGQGIAIEPSDGLLVAPFDGQVVMIADSHHAIGLKSEAGVELLIHVGLETVGLEGKPFKLEVSQGQTVQAGELLMTVDLDQIRQAGLPTITPVIVTNSQDFSSVVVSDQDDLLLTVTR
ncbi:PTS beta-glucoside transporter subunit EIIBCA [Aerococcus urinaehominis]|uniref:PTS beta-glucoside transporter subunit EIIBCA n=1 Tax=Aerococcus urinaehominis TaxID=128944 RepID=A0A0X8FKZ9_9LACT|nr:beta-glucoside-specific PTS transporter subunit IIABC [Aerococcus urinaehominis]AMB98557.1 PTS beta-glucoside transporter subunit EIIBCA [Aerococcus urinaehominis]SDL78091.1 PTS system, beta-glucosides-specific IIC component [Aerococcus urinaehominis]